jgi:hypothetical protein
MKILVDSDLIDEYILNRDNDIFPKAEKMWNIISKSSNVQTYITKRCLKKICDPENMQFPQNADIIAAKLTSMFTICGSSPSIFENVRKSRLKLEPALELECGLIEGVDAIVTQDPDKYGEYTYPIQIWSVDCLYLESCIRYETSFSGAELAAPKEMIRNTANVIEDALKLLKTAGTNGLTEKELGSRLKRSAKTTKGIVWDLAHFLMVYRDNIGKIVISPDLLDSRTEDISSCLSMALRDNVLVQEILKEIKSNQSQSITELGFDEVIRKVYPHTAKLKGKTLGDYRCRYASWLTSARIIEERNIHKFVEFIIPVSDKPLQFNAQDSMRDQLDLFEYQFSK